MIIAKDLLTFVAQAFIFGLFLSRLWAWRSTEKGRGVMTEVAPLLAYWFLVCLLMMMIAASAWFNLGSVVGLQP